MATGIHKQGDHDDQSRRNKEEQEREERELIQAAKRGDVAEVERLISELRVNPDCERDNTTPLYIACQENNVEVVEVLLEAGAQEDRANDEGMTPLMIASQNGHVCVVCALISAKANADVSIHGPKDFRKQKESMETFMSSRKRDFWLKLRHRNVRVWYPTSTGASPWKCNKDGWTPLMIASFYGRYDVVRVLVLVYALPTTPPFYGQDYVNQRSREGKTALYLASMEGHVKVVQFLMGDDDNVYDMDDETAFYLASEAGYVEVVRCLMRARAGVNICDENGWSPLMIACHGGHEVVVQELIRKGAKLNTENKGGDRAIDIAGRRGHNNIVEILQNAGAEIERPYGLY